MNGRWIAANDNQQRPCTTSGPAAPLLPISMPARSGSTHGFTSLAPQSNFTSLLRDVAGSLSITSLDEYQNDGRRPSYG